MLVFKRSPVDTGTGVVQTDCNNANLGAFLIELGFGISNPPRGGGLSKLNDEQEKLRIAV